MSNILIIPENDNARYDLTYLVGWKGIVEHNRSWVDNGDPYSANYSAGMRNSIVFSVSLAFVGAERPVIINCNDDEGLQVMILKRIDEIKGNPVDIKGELVEYMRGQKVGKEFGL